MSPGRMLQIGAIVFLLLHAIGLFLLSGFDAQGNYTAFRLGTLVMLWASVSFVVGTALAIRRRWLGEAPREITDELLPALGIAIVGALIWTFARSIF